MTIRNLARHCALVLLAMTAVSGCARDAEPDLAVESAWARATGPGQDMTAAYLTVRNAGGADRLVGVQAPAPMAASLHETASRNGVMTMQPVDALDVPANGALSLAPMGAHVMLTGLSEPLSPGMRIPLSLRFARSGDRVVDVEVLAATAAGPAR